MIWWETAGSVSMTVLCGRERHRLRWCDGDLDPVDHPELEAELALVALGGEEPPCIALHRLWHQAVADGGFVAEWVEPSRMSPAWFSWLAMALERMRAEGFHEFLRHLPHSRARAMGEFLHRFPLPLIDRAAAEVSWAATEGADGEGAWAEHGPLLRPAAGHRLRRAFVDAVGGRQLAVGAAALVPLDLIVAPGQAPDHRPRVDGRLTGPGRGVVLEVDRRWLHRVWAAGAAVVDGHLVLAIESTADRGPGQGQDRAALAQVVTWSTGGPLRPALQTRSLAHRGRGWELGPVRPSP